MKLQTEIKGDMGGEISLEFKPGSSIDDYCAKHIPNFDADRMEVMALRFYHGEETIVTVYAIDKARLEGTSFTPEKIPVKKFKMGLSFLKDILPFVKECNFTITTGHYPIEEMEVINK